MKLKIRLYKALILLIVKCVSEILTLKSSDENKLLVFEMQCLRAILGSTWADRLHIEYINKSLSMTKVDWASCQKTNNISYKYKDNSI